MYAVSVIADGLAGMEPICRVSTEFRQHGIPRNFLTSEVISAKFRRNSAKFRGIPRNFAGIEPEITSVFRGMPKCHFRGHPTHMLTEWLETHERMGYTSYKDDLMAYSLCILILSASLTLF